MTKYLICFGVIFGITAISSIAISCIMFGERRGIKKAQKKESKNNELKEKMETGDNTTDFNNSVDILHDLAKK